MGKSKKIRKLRKKLAKLKNQLTSQTSTLGPAVSPLAPKDGFPELPAIEGVAFAATSAGVRYQGRTDVMLAKLVPGTEIAGVFTKSATRSASVIDCQEKIGNIDSGGAAILVNSGNANAFTGQNGFDSVRAITRSLAGELGISECRVFTSSTGVIGEAMPHDRITDVLGELVASASPENGENAARAIMTTDTFAKGAFKEIDAGGPIRIAGIAKGSGMVAPDMATMLVYIFTDAAIGQPLLQSCLTDLTATTFNCITVDSDTSTSDTLLLAATGKSRAPKIESWTEYNGIAFKEALNGIMLDLAQQVVRDGEGASKFIEIAVEGAQSCADAKAVAMSIANSPLVKTAVAGEDPNWGRVVMAVGKSGAAADRDKLTIHFGDILVAENGWVAPGYNEDAAAAYMKQQDLVIRVDLGIGSDTATAWTCDLTNRYIEINADYRS